eukprot:TRINITY_DN12663_c0_g1_i2.p1 TRINITY_DN12663_c0_g1~~TRINITY_DN12663_c0_g1_i2.p1  ORF type:complete len:403 (+),score=111.80 TRINITY_DN12663_c0_g1_i2:36-1244(+)
MGDALIDFRAPLCETKENGERVYTKEGALKILSDKGLTNGDLANRLCVHTLMRGCVNSFIELHKLSHRQPVCIDELAGVMFKISEDTLPWIADVLAESEENKQQGKFGTVYNRYIELADFFEKSGDHETAISFHALGLKAVKLSTDKELEGAAYERFGLTHERMGNLKEAVACHEAGLRIAEAARDAQLKQRANTNLIRVYMAVAGTLEVGGAYEESREYYEKAVNTANVNDDQDAEAEAFCKLGSITVLLGDLNKALEYQKRFLMVSKQMNSEQKECRAVRECATLQEKLKQHNEAVLSLKRALEIAEDQEDLVGIGNACKQLGQLYTTLEEHIKAVHYYKECYRVAQVMGDPARIQTARIRVGLAEGNLRWGQAGGAGYVGMVSTDIQRVLGWKGHGKLE